MPGPGGSQAEFRPPTRASTTRRIDSGSVAHAATTRARSGSGTLLLPIGKRRNCLEILGVGDFVCRSRKLIRERVQSLTNNIDLSFSMLVEISSTSHQIQIFSLRRNTEKPGVYDCFRLCFDVRDCVRYTSGRGQVDPPTAGGPVPAAARESFRVRRSGSWHGSPTRGRQQPRALVGHFRGQTGARLAPRVPHRKRGPESGRRASLGDG